jgi:hypothetical protein
MPDWKDGDDIDPTEAREQTRRMLEDPAHKRPKGSPDDLATVDDPLPDGEDGGLDDPAFEEGEDD